MNTDDPEKYLPLNEAEARFNELAKDVKGDLGDLISVDGMPDELKDKVIKKAISSLPMFSFCPESGEPTFGLDNVTPFNRDMFDYNHDLENWIDDNVIDNEGCGCEHLHSDINKLYAATLFATINKYQREGANTEDVFALANFVRKAHFEISPSLANKIYDIPGQLELLSLADKGSICRKFFHSELVGDIYYDVSFGVSADELKKLSRNRNPLDLISLMQTELNLCVYEIGSIGSPLRLTPKLIDAFIDIVENKNTPPLVSMIAQHQIDIVRSVANDDYEKIALYSKDYSRNGDKTLINIAPGVHAESTKGQLDSLIDDNGRVALMSDWQSGNSFGIEFNDMFLLRMAHAPGVLYKIESELGVALEDIDLNTQIQFLRFAIEANDGRYDKLTKILNKTKDQSDKMNLIDAFLAIEFGDDFGDSILNIAEYSSENESNKIFEIINEYRKTSKEFSGQFDDIDIEFSSGTEKAMIERLTDLLVVAAEVAKNGSLIVDTAPHRDNEDYYHDGKFDIKIDSLSQVIDTMDTFSRSQELIWCIMNSSDTCITERYRKDADKIYSQTYSLINDKLGVAQFHVRRFGASSFDRVVEHGNYNGTEATISWSVNPNNPFSYPGLKDPDCMNIRFDREGRSIDEAPNSPNRSPIREDGIVSLDIGSVLGEKSSTSTIIGRTIAAGNILRSENNANKSSISLNHNTNYLPQEYGDANNFAWLATMMEQKIVNKYEHINNKKIRKIAKSLVEKSVQIAI